ncbi:MULTISPECIES: aminotransferase class V-fold PLP-dependent enzyme [unclassified Bradyrhizobium]|uniref:aminotransferase class V-fold PLP-dependent enzyme n=1 Tax=unclassified Bradyrhizobium TaxID=2631580 RepID=UPI00188D84BA|nr:MULTISPECIES: aminotransferase class V-fold PLP-dependent enzyme [unclassified Bradyrhizobium]MDN4981610.1 aminotransferase class V-fold PLP-dependent enzyme [Bradyrhizobium sp. WYCCWR 13022]QOZ52400.1 aminotransferase [Bradyrhizobium sp. CCBAU 53338]
MHYDVAAIRRQFPVTERMLYLDSAHQTPLATSVREALLGFYREGLETAGPKPVWLDRIEQVRARVAKLFNAAPAEIAFTKNTSEGMNIAANALPLTAGDNVLLVEGDHPNNAYAFLNLRRKGVEVRFVPMNGETARAEMFAPYIDARTRAISLSHVTFHAGHRFDIDGIGALCAERRLYFVIDAMQSTGVIPLDAGASGASLIGSGCHKGLLVPQGLGILYCRQGLDELQPAYLAMSSLAHPPGDYIARADNMMPKAGAGRFEIGNLNLPDIHALDASLTLIESVGLSAIEAHLYDLGDRLIERIDDLGVRLVGPRNRADRSPHIYVLDLPADAWAEYLASRQVRVSPERDGIRISFGLFNTAEDVDRFAGILAESGNLPARAGAAA